MAERNRRHVIVTRAPWVDDYAPPTSGRESGAPPSPADRIQHGRKLIDQLDAAAEAAQRRKEDHDAIQVEGALEGIYVQFQSHPGFELALTSLEPQQGSVHPELCAVTTREVEGESVQLATVFVPEGWIGRFTKRFEDYVSEDTNRGNPKNKNLVERIAELRLATLRALWDRRRRRFSRQ